MLWPRWWQGVQVKQKLQYLLYTTIGTLCTISKIWYSVYNTTIDLKSILFENRVLPIQNKVHICAINSNILPKRYPSTYHYNLCQLHKTTLQILSRTNTQSKYHVRGKSQLKNLHTVSKSGEMYNLFSNSIERNGIGKIVLSHGIWGKHWSRKLTRHRQRSMPTVCFTRKGE